MIGIFPAAAQKLCANPFGEGLGVVVKCQYRTADYPVFVLFRGRTGGAPREYALVSPEANRATV